jgi:hypothetical protein
VSIQEEREIDRSIGSSCEDGASELTAPRDRAILSPNLQPQMGAAQPIEAFLL